ncbi:ABC transporter permease [Niallia endozanthoxylica]|uniref:ABC transporter permease n=1 Tax=Niallia endozanthoxylica TaxID=2036016 RepID=A0A5J5H4K7_9BACI|nr:ABC transporter permease [Niallia endozanthoxylica]KAA9015516.1 ABC transporter permease [Niallia endozanthoxylica]
MESKVWDVLHREWMYILKNPQTIGLLFLVPLMYTFLFGYSYSGNQLKEVNTVVIDHDNSQLSRQIIQAFDESETFHITDYMQDEKELEEALAIGDIKVGIVIPENFYKRLLQGEDLPIVTMIDGSNMIVTNTTSRAANTIVSTFSYGISQTKLQQQGLQDEEIKATFSQIPYRARILYNPTSNYSDFMVYGLIGTILQQVLFLGVSLTITREKEAGVWESFAVWKSMPWRLAFAKIIPYFIVNLINTLTTLLICLYWFKLPMEGTVLPLVLLSCSFTFGVLGVGYLASLFAKTQLAATQATMLVAVPSFVLSGFTWPFEGMPDFLVTLSHALPLTYYLDGIRHVLIKGNGLSAIEGDIFSLLLIGLITFFAAFLATSTIIFKKKDEEQLGKTSEVEIPN